MLTNFVYKDSVIHKLNPLVKLFWTLLIIIVSFASFDLKYLIFLAITSFLIILLTKLSVRIMKASFFVLFPLLIMLIIFHGIVNPSATQVLFKAWFFSVKLDGLLLGLKYFFRLANFIMIAYVLIFTTHPSDLINSLLKIGLPKQLGYAVLATTQFIPLMINDAKTIMDAQQARGLETKGNVVKRVLGFTPMIMPVILSSIDSAYERTISLEIRSFFNSTKRTSFRDFVWKKSDTYSIIIMFLIVVLGGIFL